MINVKDAKVIMTKMQVIVAQVQVQQGLVRILPAADAFLKLPASA